ncbi:MAG: hypothetical protein K0S70_192 [Microbacterium sp.]|jgi:hypothetical protein|nr:hypothetical protein [Microbacterium sp.]
MTHLWESDHPYYCAEGNFYATGHHATFDSWEEFTEDGNLLYDGDPDLNLLFRWDWNAWHLEHPEDYPNGAESHVLSLFYVMQRKAFTSSVEVLVTPDDEEQVRVWLAERARTTLSIWHPILGADK